MQSDDDDVGRERATGEPGACTAWDKWEALLCEEPDDCYRLVARAGENREPGLLSIARKPIRVVNEQLTRPTQDVSIAHDFRQAICDCGRVRPAGQGHSGNLAIRLLPAAPRPAGERHARCGSRAVF